MKYKIVIKYGNEEGFMQSDGKDIEYKKYKDADRFKRCIEGCEMLCGHEIYIKEERE